jgi:hypothetical protein
LLREIAVCPDPRRCLRGPPASAGALP